MLQSLESKGRTLNLYQDTKGSQENERDLCWCGLLDHVQTDLGCRRVRTAFALAGKAVYEAATAGSRWGDSLSDPEVEAPGKSPSVMFCAQDDTCVSQNPKVPQINTHVGQVKLFRSRSNNKKKKTKAAVRPKRPDCSVTEISRK